MGRSIQDSLKSFLTTNESIHFRATLNSALSSEATQTRIVKSLMNDHEPGKIETLLRYLPGGTEGKHEKCQSVFPVSGRYSNRTPPEYKPKALPLGQPAR